MKLDLAKMSKPHLNLFFKNALKLCGVPAKVYGQKAFPNLYTTENLYGEYTPKENATETIELLLTNPMTGMQISGDRISLVDKVHMEFDIFTDAKLEIEQELLVTVGGKKLRLRVLAPNTNHAYSKVSYGYTVVVL